MTASSKQLSRSLPLWSKGSIVLGVALALVAAFFTRTLIQRGDWSDGARAVAFAAGLLACIALLVWGGRALAGHRTRRAMLQSGLLIVALLLVAPGSVLAAPSLHAAQAQYAQQRGEWAQAIAEFAASGEHAPDAPGIAGAYVSWGEHLLAGKQYAGAAEKFSAVTTTYASSGHAIVARARHDLYRTYSAWIRASASVVRYGGAGGALQTFQQYLSDPACDSACQTQLATMLALAHFQYGQQLMASQRFGEAIMQFEAVTSLYASSVYASQARASAAQAYLQRGRQQVAARACSDAVATYRTLVARYADTAEAAQAKAALAAPQPVSGTFTGMPVNPLPTVALSSHVNLSGFVFSDEYTTKPDASGAFTLSSVAQGNYNLSTRRALNNTVTYAYYHDAEGNLYTVHVGPLCPVRLGMIAYQS